MKKNTLYLVVAMLCLTIFKKQLYAQNLVMNGNFEVGSAPTYGLDDFHSGTVSNWDVAQYNGDHCSWTEHFGGLHPCGNADYVSNTTDTDLQPHHCQASSTANKFAALRGGSVAYGALFCHHTSGIRTGLQKNGLPYSMIPGHTYTLKLKIRMGKKGDQTLRVHFAKFGVNWNSDPNNTQNIRWLNATQITMNQNDYNNCDFYSFERTFVVPTSCEGTTCSGMQNMILYLEDNNSESNSPELAIDDVELYDIGCCLPYKLIENTSSLSSLTKTSNYIRAGFDAGIPNSSGNVTVLNGQNINFKAGNLIHLLPGFSVQNGANFRGALEYCTGESENTGNISVAFWPNVFTPNGDGVNDNYCVNVTGATQFSIQVFDSWGSLRFDDSGIISNSFACIWNGDCNQNCSSSKVPNGTYTCIIKFFNCSGSIEHAQTVSIFGSPGIATQKESEFTASNQNEFKPVENIADVVLDMAIANANDKLNFIITPNPTNGNIQLLFNVDQARNISVTNMLGETLYSTKDASTSLTVDLSNYAKGVYFISVINDSGQKLVKKVVKD